MSENNSNNGVCRLCQKPSLLKESHIIPKFVFNWIKNTGNGRLRNLSQVNVPIQDGFKEHLLCGECEGRLEKLETLFSRTIFHPFLKGERQVFHYDQWLYLFAISLFWRVLEHGKIPIPKTADIDGMKEQMRLLLLEGKSHLSRISVHLLAGTNPFQQKGEMIPGAIHYFSRQVDAYCMERNEKALLYIKIPRFMFLLPIQSVNNHEYKNTEITFGSGILETQRGKISDVDFISFILESLEFFERKKAEISDSQRESMLVRANRDWPLLKDKDIGLVLQADLRGKI